MGWTGDNELWVSTRGGDVLVAPQPGVTEKFENAKVPSRGFGILDVGCAPSRAPSWGSACLASLGMLAPGISQRSTAADDIKLGQARRPGQSPTLQHLKQRLFCTSYLGACTEPPTEQLSRGGQALCKWLWAATRACPPADPAWWYGPEHCAGSLTRT